MVTKKADSSATETTAKAADAKKPFEVTWLARTCAPLKRAPFVGAVVAEIIGTFMLAAAIIAGQGQPIIIMFAIAGVVLLVGTLSGAHINPAITIGAWVTRKITGFRAFCYIVAQFIGAVLAFTVLNSFVHGAPAVSAAAQAYGQTAVALFQATALPVDKEWYVFFAELLGTTIFGFAVANALREKKDRVASALAYGLGLFVALLVAASAASYVGGSAILNPAAALSLGALKFELWPLAVYILAPVIGGVLGFVLQDILRVEADGGECSC